MFDKLQGKDGIQYDKDNGLKDMVLQYLENLSKKGSLNVDSVLQCIESKVILKHNQMLMATFTEEEVKTEIISMHLDKSLGVDGCNLGFYQRFQKVVGKDVIEAIMRWLEQGIFSKGLNSTDIVLKPKKNKLTNMKQLRPMVILQI